MRLHAARWKEQRGVTGELVAGNRSWKKGASESARRRVISSWRDRWCVKQYVFLVDGSLGASRGVRVDHVCIGVTTISQYHNVSQNRDGCYRLIM